MRKITFLLVLSLLPATVWAQTREPAITWEVGFFRSGVDPSQGGAPIQAPNLYDAASLTCGQPKIMPPGGVVTNPTVIRWDDPQDGAKDCFLPVSQTAAFLSSVPTGTGYKAAVRGRGQTNLPGPWSVLSNPFEIAPLPPRPPESVRVQ